VREKSSKKLHCCETKSWKCVFSSSFYKSKLETYNFLSIIMTTCIPLISLFGRTIYGFMRAPDKYFSFTFVMIVMVFPRLWSHTSGLKLTWNWNLLQLKFELVGRPTSLQLPKTLQKQKKLVTKASSGGICGTCFHQLLPSCSNYQLRSKRSLSNCSQWSKAGSNLYKK
jgi:hypothetical protein